MKWLEPWVAIADLDWDEPKVIDYRRGWETQLRREVGPKHVLFEKPASLIARRFDTDDALFELSGGKVAAVHLTWARGQEQDPRWPGCQIYDSLEEWARDGMTADHEDWSASDAP